MAELVGFGNTMILHPEKFPGLAISAEILKWEYR